MKTHLAGIALFAATVSAVALYPSIYSAAGANTTSPPTISATHTVPPKNQLSQPQIEVVFVLDTTSSMRGFIQAAKEKIWSIASTMASAQPARK